MTHPDNEERNNLIDLLCDTHQYPEYAGIDAAHFDTLSTRQLHQMLNREPVTPDSEEPLPRRPLSLSEALALYPDFEPKPKRKRGLAPRLYRAQIKHNGRNVYLGSFYTPVEAHAAIEQVKFLRSLGLPIK